MRGTAPRRCPLVLHSRRLGRPTLAARLVGAAEAAGDWRTNRTIPGDVAAIDAHLAALCSALGDAAYDASWAAGRAQPLSAIVADLRYLDSQDGAPMAPKIDPVAAAKALSLTPREHEIVALPAQGLTDRGIADRLVISASNHVTVVLVLAKLNLATRSADGVFAIRHGLITG